MSNERLLKLAHTNASQYRGRILKTPERRYDKTRGEYWTKIDVMINDEMAARIAENVRRIARHILSNELPG